MSLVVWCAVPIAAYTKQKHANDVTSESKHRQVLAAYGSLGTWVTLCTDTSCRMRVILSDNKSLISTNKPE